MKLKDVIKGISYELIKGNLDSEVEDICYDSRKVFSGCMFVCLVGANSDGHNYIDMAISKGARVIVIEKDVEIDADVTVIKLDDTRRGLSHLAINFFRNPAGEMTLIGITGTKGKTTTSYMIKNILEEEGYEAGVIGTIGINFKDKHYSTVNTTPESYEIQKYLREMADAHIKYVIMEVSSQALKVGRVSGMEFDYGIFTNLTRDHIGEGEHENMEDYIYSKSLLFKMCKCGIFNSDDEHFEIMKSGCKKVYTYGTKKADLIIDEINLLRREHFLGISIHYKGIIDDIVLVNTPGEFSAYNSAAAMNVCYLLGCSVESMKKALLRTSVKGRVEIVPVSDKYTVIIDYAHNGVSIRNVLETIRAYNPKRIVSLFGCGGNRSKDRRYDMGEVSGSLSDLTIVTEDNSRDEDVNDIMNDIEVGLKKTNGKYIKIPDRTEAIKYAIKNATEGDIILLLGKGHETYQEKNGIRIHYDEREVIQDIVKNGVEE